MIASRRQYRILGVGVSLESDSCEFSTYFDTEYGWFRSELHHDEKQLLLTVLLNTDDGKAVLYSNGAAYPLRPHYLRFSVAYQLVLDCIFREIQEYVLLHAGVVARGDDVLILTGPSSAGKTTLVVRLVENSFTFFSDDICPINIETGLVHPFPRSLKISPTPSSDIVRSTITEGRPRRSFVSPGELNASVGREPLRPKLVIFLDPEDTAGAFHESVVWLMEHAEERFLDELKNFKEITCSRSGLRSGEWVLRYPRGQRLSRRIMEIVTRYQKEIWDFYTRPDFSRDPVLRRMPNHEAAFHLIREIKQKAPFPSRPGQPAERPGVWLIRLSELLEGVTCYRLSVGRLDATIDLLMQLTKDSAAMEGRSP